MVITSLPLVLSILVGSVLPLLVNLVTKDVASSALKAVLLAGLAAVTGVLTPLTQAGANHYDWRNIVVSVGLAWVTAVATHFGFYKPTNVKIAPTVGLS